MKTDIQLVWKDGHFTQHSIDLTGFTFTEFNIVHCRRGLREGYFAYDPTKTSANGCRVFVETSVLHLPTL